MATKKSDTRSKHGQRVPVSDIVITDETDRVAQQGQIVAAGLNRAETENHEGINNLMRLGALLGNLDTLVGQALKHAARDDTEASGK